MNEQIKRLSYIKIFFIFIRRKIEGNNAAKNRIVPEIFFIPTTQCVRCVRDK